MSTLCLHCNAYSELFKNTDVFPGFDPYYYQCSRRTTSVEVETVFRRAVNRQKAHEVNSKDKFHCGMFCCSVVCPWESGTVGRISRRMIIAGQASEPEGMHTCYSSLWISLCY